MSSPRLNELVLFTACLFWSCGEGTVGNPMPTLERRPPNLVLISLDNLGAAHMGAYGATRDTTPFLDDFARHGMLFENAFVQATWTLPSHASLLSSRFVGAHGVSGPEFRFPEGPALLPEVLQAEGWQTAAFTSCLFVSALYGLDRGFDQMVTQETSCDVLAPLILEHVGQLEDLDESPFFLFLHFYDIHQPFDEPNPYGEDFSAGFPEEELEDARRMTGLIGREAAGLTEPELSWLAERFPDVPVRNALAEAAARGDVLDDKIMRFVYRYLAEKGAPALEARKGRYDNGVANMDSRLAALFDSFAAFPWYEDTVFVITSDHGESFNEPIGVIGHGGAGYREQAHVPLIMQGPGIPTDRRIRTPVESIDIAPTLLELVGVEAPDGFQGRSLGALLRGGSIADRPVLTGALKAGTATVRAEDWTYLVLGYGRERRLFQDASRNVEDQASAHADIVERMDAWLRGMERSNAELVHSLDVQAAELDEDDRARLRALGYLK